MKWVLQEALLVAVAGAVLAFAANAISPRGLRLGKNYYPGNARSSLPSSTGTAANGSPSAPTLAERFEKEGLQLAGSKQVNQLFNDPRRQQDLVVFIDARNDEHYQAGHIPGAYLFDHYHDETYLPLIIPVCQSAEQIVVYCDGGECDLSERAALDLRDGIPVPKEKIFVYGGGIAEWRGNGMPVEFGPRNSGHITNAVPGKPE